MQPSRWVVLTLGPLALASAASTLAEKVPEPAPVKPGLVEGVETRLIQFEVRISRKGAPVSNLTARDLDIELGGKPVKAFTVDDMCGDVPAAVAAARHGSSIFYFDEPELTMDGRRRAVEVARMIAPALLTRGHDILIVRNGASLRAETKWTHDAAELSAALDRIASDPGYRDYLRNAQDEVQAERVIDRAKAVFRDIEMRRMQADRTQNSDGKNGQRAAESAMEAAAADAAISQAIGELTTLVNDELHRSDRDLERLSEAARLLSAREAPKNIVYFADTLRPDPGAILVRELQTSAATGVERLDTRVRSQLATWNALGAVQDLVRVASTYGARFYAVEGRGIAASSTGWLRSAQDTLASLALDTGGLSFVNGVAASSIANRIGADQSCWYLVSFDPTGWDEDRPLGLGVWPKERGLRVNTVTSLVIPSRDALTEARLVAAQFGQGDTEERPLSVSIYPVGGTAKRFQVMAQVRLPQDPESRVHDTTWEVGFQVVSEGDVVSRTSSRVAWRGNGPPPVYQTTLTLPWGAYEIVAIARDLGSDSIHQGRINGTWPAVSGGAVTLSVTSVAQPQKSGVVVDGEVNPHGIVVRGEGEPVDPREPAGFVTSACITGADKAVFRAERSILGATEVPFAPTNLSPDKDRCVQIRDMVPANSLGAGWMTYSVRVLSGEAVVASQELSFEVADVAAVALSQDSR